MQQLLQITFRGVERSAAVENRIRAEVERLERVCSEITRCHVTVAAEHHHHHQGNIYSVHIDLHIPHKELVVKTNGNRHAHEDVYVAVRDAFASAMRRLEDRTRQKRREVKHHEGPIHGRVTRLNNQEGYGFIELSDGMDVYFHQNTVPEDGFRKLDVGDEVRVVLATHEGRKGPQASTVTRVGKHHVDEARAD